MTHSRRCCNCGDRPGVLACTHCGDWPLCTRCRARCERSHSGAAYPAHVPAPEERDADE